MIRPMRALRYIGVIALVSAVLLVPLFVYANTRLVID